MKILPCKKMKDFPKERDKLFEISKEIKTVIMDSNNTRLYYSIIELRILRNMLSHMIERLEQGDINACKDNEQVQNGM